MPDLVQCALLHEQFEAIHPFSDGNGRLGRLLITLFLIERERLTQPMLYLSAYLEAHRSDYYDLLQRVRTDCDWNAWILFFLTGVAETAQAAVKQAGQLMDLREEWRSRLRGRGKVVDLVDQLFINPYLTVKRAAEVLKVSNEAARHAVSVLEEGGLLAEITGKAWGRVYLARPILSIISES
jgi:Fic family protein